jgi:hypothetical protein
MEGGAVKLEIAMRHELRMRAVRETTRNSVLGADTKANRNWLVVEFC